MLAACAWPSANGYRVEGGGSNARRRTRLGRWYRSEQQYDPPTQQGGDDQERNHAYQASLSEQVSPIEWNVPGREVVEGLIEERVLVGHGVGGTGGHNGEHECYGKCRQKREYAS